MEAPGPGDSNWTGGGGGEKSSKKEKKEKKKEKKKDTEKKYFTVKNSKAKSSPAASKKDKDQKGEKGERDERITTKNRGASRDEAEAELEPDPESSSATTTSHTVHDELDLTGDDLSTGSDVEVIEVPIRAYEDQDHWAVVGCTGSPPPSRNKHTAVHYNGSLYIFGGDDGNSRLNDLYQFIIAKKEWRKVTTSGNPPKPRYYHSAVVEGPCMYVFGGYTDHNHNDTFQYHFGTREWTQLECTGEVPSQRSGHNAVMYNGAMYVFGGYDGSKRLNDLFKLDISKREWEAVESTGKAPTSRCNASAVVIEGSMLVFAGHSGVATNADLYEYNFESRTWSQIECSGDAPSKRLGHTSVCNQDHMYIFGGTAANNFCNDLYRLNIQKKEWVLIRTTGPTPFSRCYHTAVVVDTVMYIFGGAPPDAHPLDLYSFTFAAVDPPCTLSDDMGAFLEKGELADVTFLVEKEPITAHSLILQVRCPPLYELAAQEQQRPSAEGGSSTGGGKKQKRQGKGKGKGKKKDESSTSSSPPSSSSSFPASSSTLAPVEVELSDVPSAQAFREILYFIYTDEVRFSPKMTLSQLFELLALATRFRLDRFVRLCERYIISSVSLDNVIAVLKLVQSDKGGVVSAVVKEFSIMFVLRHYQDVIVQQAFETVGPALLVEIMRLYQQFTATKSSKYQAAAAARPVEIPPSKLADDLARLRRDETTWDFTFYVRGKPLGAHLVMLLARTGFFQGALRSTMKGGDLHTRQMAVVIGSVQPTPEAFASFLDYIYTGRVDTPPDEAVYLLTASGFYGLTNDRLKAIASKQITQKLHRNNILRVLEAASDVGARQLKHFVLEQVVKDFAHLMRTQADQVRQLSKALLIDIMTSLALTMPPSSSSSHVSSSLAFSPSASSSAPSSSSSSSSASPSASPAQSGLGSDSSGTRP